MRIIRTGIASALMVGTLALGSVAFAQVTPDSPGVSKPSSKDANFVKMASAGGMTEVAASQLAATHSQSPAVQSFAATMVADHSKANEQLMALAMKTGFTASNEPTSAQQASINNLKALQGASFDSAYTAMMLKDHQETVAMFKAEAMSGASLDLKEFATKTLPTLEGHLAMAQKL